nr:unnamed protein product [Digitaria exilis]
MLDKAIGCENTRKELSEQKRKFQSSSSGQTSNTRPRGNGGHYQQGQQAQRSGQQAQRYSQQTPRTPNQQQNRSGNGTPPVRTNNPVTPTPQAQRSDGQRSVQSSSQQGNQGQQNYARGRVNHVTAEAAQEASDVPSPVILSPGLFLFLAAAHPAQSSVFSFSSFSVADMWARPVGRLLRCVELEQDSMASPSRARLPLVSPAFISRRPSPIDTQTQARAFLVALVAIAAVTLGLKPPPPSSLQARRRGPREGKEAAKPLSSFSLALSSSRRVAVATAPLAVVSLHPLSRAKRGEFPSFLALVLPKSGEFPAELRRAPPLSRRRSCPFDLSQNDPFEGGQDQVFEEEPPQYFEQGKGPSGSLFSFVSVVSYDVVQRELFVGDERNHCLPAGGFIDGLGDGYVFLQMKPVAGGRCPGASARRIVLGTVTLSPAPAAASVVKLGRFVVPFRRGCSVCVLGPACVLLDGRQFLARGPRAPDDHDRGSVGRPADETKRRRWILQQSIQTDERTKAAQEPNMTKLFVP